MKKKPKFFEWLFGKKTSYYQPEEVVNRSNPPEGTVIMETDSAMRFINCQPMYIKRLRLNPDKFYH